MTVAILIMMIMTIILLVFNLAEIASIAYLIADFVKCVEIWQGTTDKLDERKDMK